MKEYDTSPSGRDGAPRKWRRRLRALGRAMIGVAAAVSATAVRADVNYYYDDLGRLVEAADPTSSKATLYSYDAAGNITSVVNNGFSTLAISALAPTSGNVGDKVTITGTGFSATAGDNDVEFTGGVRGTVQSNPIPTATRLVVSVPTGAKSGPVTVKVGTNTATSPNSFTLVTGTNAPTITSFTPTQGASGTTVNITGTHFQTVAGNNKVAFNNGYAAVITANGTASATSLSVNVPASATSGPIQVSTPNGTAISSSVFVVPTNFASGTGLPNLPIVGSAAVLNPSQAVSGEPLSNGSYSLMVFSGTAGQYPVLSMSALTGSGCNVIVAAPNGLPLSIMGSDGIAAHQVTLSASGQGIQLPKLPMSGSYSVLVTARDTNGGKATFTLYDEQPLTLTMGGSASATLAAPGQRVLVTFQGNAGGYVKIATTSDSIGRAQMSLMGPDGNVLLASTIAAPTGGTLQPLMPLTGTYQLLIDPAGAIAGTIKLSMNGVTLTQLGQTVPIGFTSTFTSTQLFYADVAGDFPAINFVSAVAATATLTGPDGAAVGSPLSIPGSNTGVVMNPLSPSPLAESGVYTLTINATGAGQTYVTMSAAALAPITMNKGQTQSATSTPSQWLDVQFDASLGQYAAVALTVSHPGNYLVVGPDGSQLAGGALAAGSPVIDIMSTIPAPLPANGHYHLLLQQSNASGTVLLTPSTAPMALDGTVPAIPINSSNGIGVQTQYIGQWMQLSFNSQSYSSLHLLVSGSGTSSVWVLDPTHNNSVIATGQINASFLVSNLAANTNYTVVTQPASPELLNFKLTAP